MHPRRVLSKLNTSVSGKKESKRSEGDSLWPKRESGPAQKKNSGVLNKKGVFDSRKFHEGQKNAVPSSKESL